SNNVVEQNRRAIRKPCGDLGNAADLEPRVRPLDPPQRVQAVDKPDEFAQVLIHCNSTSEIVGPKDGLSEAKPIITLRAQRSSLPPPAHRGVVCPTRWVCAQPILRGEASLHSRPGSREFAWRSSLGCL